MREKYICKNLGVNGGGGCLLERVRNFYNEFYKIAEKKVRPNQTSQTGSYAYDINHPVYIYHTWDMKHQYLYTYSVIHVPIHWELI